MSSGEAERPVPSTVLDGFCPITVDRSDQHVQISRMSLLCLERYGRCVFAEAGSRVRTRSTSLPGNT